MFIDCAGSEIRDTCFRSTTVMEAGKEVQCVFLITEGLEGREMHRRMSPLYDEHSMSCSRVLDGTRVSARNACHCNTMLNILLTSKISPHAT